MPVVVIVLVAITIICFVTMNVAKKRKSGGDEVSQNVAGVVDKAMKLSASILSTFLDTISRTKLDKHQECLLALVVEQQKSIHRVWTAINEQLEFDPPQQDDEPMEQKEKNKIEERNAVLIYPVENSHPSDILSDIRTHIDVRQNAIRVVHTKPISASGLMVQLYTKQDLDNFVRVLKEHPIVGRRYKATIPSKLDPRVIVFEVDSDESSLLKTIQDLGGDGCRVQAIKKKRTLRGNTNYVLSLDGVTFRKVMAEGKISMDWAMYNVMEYDTVKQCFRCGRFGHFGQMCRREKRCLSCGYPTYMHDDEKSHCNWKPKCINCHERNARGRQLATDHVFHDHKCPIWQAEARRFKERHIDYGTDATT